jgi:hypothetical protein
MEPVGAISYVLAKIHASSGRDRKDCVRYLGLMLNAASKIHTLIILLPTIPRHGMAQDQSGTAQVCGRKEFATTTDAHINYPSSPSLHLYDIKSISRLDSYMVRMYICKETTSDRSSTKTTYGFKPFSIIKPRSICS